MNPEMNLISTIMVACDNEEFKYASYSMTEDDIMKLIKDASFAMSSFAEMCMTKTLINNADFQLHLYDFYSKLIIAMRAFTLKNCITSPALEDTIHHAVMDAFSIMEKYN